jgi:hypothetical protein
VLGTQQVPLRQSAEGKGRGKGLEGGGCGENGGFCWFDLG